MLWFPPRRLRPHPLSLPTAPQTLPPPRPFSPTTWRSDGARMKGSVSSSCHQCRGLKLAPPSVRDASLNELKEYSLCFDVACKHYSSTQHKVKHTPGLFFSPLALGSFIFFCLLCGTSLYRHKNHWALNSLTASNDSGYLQSHQISINSLQRSASFFFFLASFPLQPVKPRH